MDIDNMVFSKDDKEQLKENRNKINEWIMENIVPKLAINESIQVDYGGYYRARGDFGEGTTMYHFAVYGEERSFSSSGGERTRGYVGIGEKYGGISHAIQVVGNPYELYPIIENWEHIKSCLINESNARANAKKNGYVNFCVFV
jgi:hypothetical protein